MKLSYLGSFITNINAAIDTGTYRDVSVRDIETHIADGDLIPFLVRLLADDADLSIFTPEAGLATDYGKELNQQLLDMLSAYHGQEKRKFGIGNNGLNLLIAFAADLMVCHKWE
jgi:hypothetical protein